MSVGRKSDTWSGAELRGGRLESDRHLRHAGLSHPRCCTAKSNTTIRIFSTVCTRNAVSCIRFRGVDPRPDSELRARSFVSASTRRCAHQCFEVRCRVLYAGCMIECAVAVL
eukprot:3642304-Rhodomonas_salina.1